MRTAAATIGRRSWRWRCNTRPAFETLSAYGRLRRQYVLKYFYCCAISPWKMAKKLVIDFQGALLDFKCFNHLLHLIEFDLWLPAL